MQMLKREALYNKLDRVSDLCFLHEQDNIFEWHFAIRGPSDSEFEGGIYHGRIQLPPEYPFKPPAFVLLTVRIRLRCICLEISGF